MQIHINNYYYNFMQEQNSQTKILKTDSNLITKINIDKTSLLIPEIAMASSNKVMAKPFLTQAQHLSRAESDFYKKIKLYLTAIMPCIDSQHDTHQILTKWTQTPQTKEVYSLVKQCAKTIRHQDPSKHAITYFVEDKKERHK